MTLGVEVKVSNAVEEALVVVKEALRSVHLTAKDVLSASYTYPRSIRIHGSKRKKQIYPLSMRTLSSILLKRHLQNVVAEVWRQKPFNLVKFQGRLLWKRKLHPKKLHLRRLHLPPERTSQQRLKMLQKYRQKEQHRGQQMMSMLPRKRLVRVKKQKQPPKPTTLAKLLNWKERKNS